MSQELPPPTPDPVVRFRMRTLIYATTGIAILAAIAGPYFRQQSPEAQTRLAAYWTGILIFSAVGLWRSWKTTWRSPPNVRFLVWTARKRFSPMRHVLGPLLFAVLWFAIVADDSTDIIDPRRASRDSMWAIILRGLWIGIITGGGLIVFTRRPAFLTDGGIRSSHGFGPWTYIRHAEWVSGRPGVMKFRRLDGDIYVDVPAKDRAAVEEFVREKTEFVDGGGISKSSELVAD